MKIKIKVNFLHEPEDIRSVMMSTLPQVATNLKTDGSMWYKCTSEFVGNASELHELCLWINNNTPFKGSNLCKGMRLKYTYQLQDLQDCRFVEVACSPEHFQIKNLNKAFKAVEKCSACDLADLTQIEDLEIKRFSNANPIGDLVLMFPNQWGASKKFSKELEKRGIETRTLANNSNYRQIVLNDRLLLNAKQYPILDYKECGKCGRTVKLQRDLNWKDPYGLHAKGMNIINLNQPLTLLAPADDFEDAFMRATCTADAKRNRVNTISSFYNSSIYYAFISKKFLQEIWGEYNFDGVGFFPCKVQS